MKHRMEYQRIGPKSDASLQKQMGATTMLAAQFRKAQDRAEPRTAEPTTKTTLLEFSREVLKPAVDVVLKGNVPQRHFPRHV